MTAPGLPLLQVRDLSRRFGAVNAVDHVGFDVAPRELTAIIGPNGAGKTTLLNLLSGHLTPTSGQVVFEGKAVSRLSRHEICQRGIGRSFQQASFFPSLTVLQNVQVPLIRAAGLYRRPVGDSAAACQDEAGQVLDSMALQIDRKSPAGLLSYGDQRRLEIAIALGCEPRLLLLDEPTAGVSPAERRSLTQLIASLNRDRGITILFTEHDMDVVFAIATKIHVLHQGRLLATGTPEEIRRHPGVRRVYLGEDLEP